MRIFWPGSKDYCFQNGVRAYRSVHGGFNSWRAVTDRLQLNHKSPSLSVFLCSMPSWPPCFRHWTSILSGHRLSLPHSGCLLPVLWVSSSLSLTVFIASRYTFANRGSDFLPGASLFLSSPLLHSPWLHFSDNALSSGSPVHPWPVVLEDTAAGYDSAYQSTLTGQEPLPLCIPVRYTPLSFLRHPLPPARTVAKASMVIPSTPGTLPCDYWALSCPGIWLVTFLCRFSYFNVLRNYKTLNKCRRYFFAPSLVGGKGFSVDVYSSGITSPLNKASPFRTKISFPISVFQTSWPDLGAVTNFTLSKYSPYW